MIKRKIKLYDAVGLGLIISLPTGIEFTNQTGGNACYQLSIEGIYVPIANDCSLSNELISPEIDLIEYFSKNISDKINEKDIFKINEILEKYDLSELIRIDKDKINKSFEAWIYVDIIQSERFGYLLENFEFPLKGVLTWFNSD